MTIAERSAALHLMDPSALASEYKHQDQAGTDGKAFCADVLHCSVCLPTPEEVWHGVAPTVYYPACL